MISLTSEAKSVIDKHKNDQGKLDRLWARQARLLGIWAAEEMFLYGENASEYSINTVLLAYEKGNNYVKINIKNDMKKENIDFDNEEFDKKYSKLIIEAERQILQEQDIYA